MKPLTAFLTWAPDAISIFAGFFSFFGFLISRLPRFCSLAMVKRPFDESCRVGGLWFADRLQAVLRGHPFMTFLVAADAVLWRTAAWRKRAGDVIEIGRRSRYSKTSPYSYGLSNGKEMLGILVPGLSAMASDNVCGGHDSR